MIKKTVRYIKPADHSDHIISHVLMEHNGTTERQLKKDYHVQWLQIFYIFYFFYIGISTIYVIYVTHISDDP